MAYVLGVRRRLPASKDAHGNTTVGYADPVPWTVMGYAPGAATEAGADNRDLSVIAWTVYAPAGPDVPTEYDRVDVDGITYDVDGRPADYTRGPWPHPTAGVVVELKRTEG